VERALQTNDPESRPSPRAERATAIVTSVAVGLSAILLAVLFGADLATGTGLRKLENAKDPLDIRLTGHQWWWDVQYEPGPPSQITRTANEIHIPIGKPVRLTLQSADVIHSLWLPNIAGKKDLIPGHPTTLTIQADRPETFQGQCAEFCGLQHAHMRLLLVAHTQPDFDKWMASQHTDAPEPTSDSQKRGRDVFLQQTCVMCHTINGTIANSRVGPDLTHIASRTTIASGSVPNTRGFLAGWILDPQHLKSGVKMPSQTLAGDDLQALLDYLELLK
jgi:cytochrome c oxidase subunit 2